jgi:hypothetical protein
VNLERLLGQARQAGTLHSRGQFTTGLAGMVDRLASHRLLDESLAPLLAVASAVAAGAERLEIATRRKELTFDFAMKALDPGPESHAYAFEAGPSRHLLLVALAWRDRVDQVSIRFDGQGREMIMDRQLVEWKSCSAAEPGVQVRVAGKVPGASAMRALLVRHCGLSPVPLWLNGESLACRLESAEARWSDTVPDHLRPLKEATLEGPPALWMSASRQSSPSWVAVVGGISYPFVLPEAPGVRGIVWSDSLTADLGLTGLVQDGAWSALRRELLQQVR